MFVRITLRCVAFGLAALACVATPTKALAQQPIVVGAADLPDPGPSVCDRKFGDDSLERWFRGLILPLCHRDDSDSLLAVYLFSMPGLGSSSGTLDGRVLQRAYARGKSDAKLLWVVSTQSDCEGPIAGCKAAQTAVEAAQALTTADPNNAMAWFALARAQDLALADPATVDAALDRAARAPRVHDYTFDLIKLAERASAHVPGSAGLNPDEGRFAFVSMIPMLNERFKQWAGRCSVSFDEGDPDRKKSCDVAREQFKRGDSLLTLSGDPRATASMKAAQVPPPGVSGEQFRKVLLETIPPSTSESDWYGRVTSRLERIKAGQ